MSVPAPGDAAGGDLPPLPTGRTYDVVCLGLNAFDHLCLVDRLPRRGEKLRMGKLVQGGGGQSATAACALARLGHKVAYQGVAGDDEPGRRAGRLLAEAGVDAGGLVIKPGTGSQQAFIMVEPGGERTIVWQRDQACRLAPEDLRPELLEGCRVLHLDGHFVKASIAAARLARRAGALICLDGERVAPGTAELVSLCHVVMGQGDFAQRLSQQSDPHQALAALAALGPLWAGRTLGPAGAEMLAGGRLHQQPGFEVPALDTTGAGDVFHAGMAHALLLGQGPAAALATACALAAISTTGLGGRAALPTRAALQAFLAERAT